LSILGWVFFEGAVIILIFHLQELWRCSMITDGEILLRILIAAGLGMLVGLERERQSQPAGLRTHIVLVCGSTLAMVLSINLAMQFRGLVPNGDPARLAAQVLSGIGFLGAGAILRFGPTVKGLTTAASLWTMAVVGLAVGAGYLLAAAGGTALLLVVLIVLTRVENRMIIPNISAQFSVYAIDRAGVVQQVRDLIRQNSLEVDHFRLRRNVSRQRVRIDAVVKVHGSEALEQLSAKISEIEGVKVVKYE